jgi:hypothetical protein
LSNCEMPVRRIRVHVSGRSGDSAASESAGPGRVTGRGLLRVRYRQTAGLGTACEAPVSGQCHRVRLGLCLGVLRLPRASAPFGPQGVAHQFSSGQKQRKMRCTNDRSRLQFRSVTRDFNRYDLIMTFHYFSSMGSAYGFYFSSNIPYEDMLLQDQESYSALHARVSWMCGLQFYQKSTH